MATDLEKLVVQLSADIKGFDRELAKVNGISNRQFRAVENRARQMNRNLDAIFARSFSGLAAPITGIATALSVREVARYADAWTVAGNKLAAASQVAGMQARSLEDLNKIANDTRGGITETADLYSKLMRSTKGVAESEMEVARATEIVNKAFKAGGAAASEQAAGILQLGQGLGSGMLQGDELRSVRENAPLLAQAIADYFKVSIAGLKDLGSEGKLTSDKVFKAILSAQPQIEAAFSKTNATIADGMTKVDNAMTQYVGKTDAGLGASQRLIGGLNALADNFDTTADIVLKLAAVIAGALVGRSLVSMVRGLGLATSGTLALISALRTASSVSGVAQAFGGLGAAAGPLGMIIGGTVVGALALYASNASAAAAQSQGFEKELESLGLLAPRVADGIDSAAKSIKGLGDGQAAQKIRSIADEIKRLRTGGGTSSLVGGLGDELNSIGTRANHGTSFLASFFDDAADQKARASIVEMARGFRDVQLTAAQVKTRLDEIRATSISDGVKKMADELDRTVQKITGLQAQSLSLGEMPGLKEAQGDLDNVINRLGQLERMELITSEQRANLEAALKKLRDTGTGADEARAALAAIGGVGFSTTLNGLDTMISKVATLYAQADAARRMMAGITDGGVSDNSKNAYVQYQNRRNADNEALSAGKALAEEAKRQNSLSKEQLATEKEIASIRKDLAKNGGFLPDNEIKKLAAANIAAEARRADEGKKPKGQKDVKKTADSRFDADIQSVRDRTAALLEEARITSLSYQEQEKRRMALDLEQAALADLREEARKKGQTDLDNIKLSPEQVSKINAVSEAYAKQADELRKVQEAQDRAEGAAQEFYDTFKSGMVGAITGAESLQDALSGILKKLAEMILNSAFDAIFGGASASQSGGWLTGAMKAIGFAKGGVFANGASQPLEKFAGGGVSRTAAIFGEAGPEAAVPLPDGRRIPVDLKMPALKAPTMPTLKAPNLSGGTVSTPVHITIDATGADAAGLARVQHQLAKLKSEIPAQVVQSVRKAQKSNVRF